MEIEKRILREKAINPEEPVIKTTKGEALVWIDEAIFEYTGKEIDFRKFSREDLEKILEKYGDEMINHLPEQYHQERATVINCEDIFIKHGLEEEDIESMEFC